MEQQIDVKKPSDVVRPEKIVQRDVGSSRRKRVGKIPRWLSVVIIIVIVVVVEFGVWAAIYSIESNSAMSSINKSEYQALFLTNGQVYFGKITAINSNYIKIIDIYYLQAQQTVQPQTTSQQKLSLIKLGNELHGPEDEMFVARPQILFWENLKNNGKVVQAILQNQGQ